MNSAVRGTAAHPTAHVTLDEQHLLSGPGVLTALPRGQRGLKKSHPDGFARTASLREAEAFLFWKIIKLHKKQMDRQPIAWS